MGVSEKLGVPYFGSIEKGSHYIGLGSPIFESSQ